jgi:excisionase family DNA binding protein
MTPPNSTGRRWLSIRETSEYVGLSVGCVYELCLAKKLPSCRIGRNWRVDKLKLDEDLDRQTKAGSR